MNVERRTFLKRTGSVVAIGAVATQPAIATAEGNNRQRAAGTLGPAGSYSHRAALQTSDNISFYDTMFEVADAVVTDEVETGVLPIENSIQGAVVDTLHILLDNELFIEAEIFEEIRHALMAQSDDFDTIVSHPQALGQSNAYLEEQHPDVEIQEIDSTSGGVELAAENPFVAAIAHPDLAEEYSLDVIAEDIQDVDNNVTRFFEFSGTLPKVPGEKSTVLVYPGIGQPGLPVSVLNVFAEMDVDLLRIESLPSEHELGDYAFHIDFEYHDPGDIVCQLEKTIDWVRYLGSYDSISETTSIGKNES